MGITKGRYIDVGANHPTKLSNTYRLYREGFTEIVMEPYCSLLRLHHMIRPNDLHLGIGCGDMSALPKSSTPPPTSSALSRTTTSKPPTPTAPNSFLSCIWIYRPQTAIIRVHTLHCASFYQKIAIN